MTIPWVHSYSDLRSVGVRVSEQQQFVAENGGRVLIVQRLPAVDICGCGQDHGSPQVMPNGEPMMIPATFAAIDPNDGYSAGWNIKARETVAEALEANMGQVWRSFPSYIGVADTQALEEYYEEEPRPVRLWTGLPLMTDAEIALGDAIVAGFTTCIATSPYLAMRELLQMEFAAMEWGEFELDDPDEEGAQQYRDLRSALIKDGYVVDASTEDNPLDWGPGLPLEFPPIERFVSPEGLALWRTLLLQSQHGFQAVLGAIPADRQQSFLYHEIESEPWL